MLRAAAVFCVFGAITSAIFVWSTHGAGELLMARNSMAWFAVASVAAILLGRTGALALVNQLVAPAWQKPARTRWVLAGAVCAILIFCARVVLDGFLNSGDEYAYFLQAQTFARGKLWVDAPSPASAFELMRFMEKDGRWLSIYQPGWPLILTLPVALGIPVWLVCPIFGALTVLVFFRLAERLMRVESAFLATLGLCTSAFFIFNFASLFSHAPGALAAVLFAFCGLRFLEQGAPRWALLAGVSLGALGFIRAINAVLLVLPFLVAVLATPRRRLGLFWFCLGGVPFAVLLLAYNKLITGNPLLLVQAWLLHGSEPIGPPTASSMGESLKRLVRLFLWTSPTIFVGWPLAFGVVAWRRRLSFVDWLAPATLIGFALYGGEGGIQHGPRYYLEGWSFALITVGKAIEPIFSAGAKRAEWLAAAILAHLTFQLGYLVPRASREHTVVMERQGLYRKVARAGLDNALVLDDVGTTRPLPPRDLVRNGLTVGDEPVTYALDKDDQTTQILRQRFPKRRFYRFYGGELHDVLDRNGQFIPKPPGFW